MALFLKKISMQKERKAHRGWKLCPTFLLHCVFKKWVKMMGFVTGPCSPEDLHVPDE